MGVVCRIHGAALHESGLDGVDGGCVTRVVVSFGCPDTGEDVDLRQEGDVVGPHVRACAQAVVDGPHAFIRLMRGGCLFDGAIPAHERGCRLESPATLRVGVLAFVDEERVLARPQARIVAHIRAVVGEPGKMALGKVDVRGLARFEQVRFKRRQRAECPAVAVNALVLHARDERGAVHVAKVVLLR